MGSSGDFVGVDALEAHSDTTVKFLFRKVHEIERGSFGVVSKIRTAEGKYLAVKQLVGDLDSHSSEIGVMKRLKHPNIVRILFSFDEQTANGPICSIVMDLVPESLSALIQNVRIQRKHFDETTIALIVCQIFRGLAHLHARNIAHRDVKPANILLDPGSMKVKICDFGSAAALCDNVKQSSYVGSRWYRAPELFLRCSGYSCKIDVWSTACVLAELLLLRPLFAGADTVGHLYEIEDILGTPSECEMAAMGSKIACCSTIARQSLAKFFAPDVSSEFLKFLDKCFVYSAASRPSAWASVMEFLAVHLSIEEVLERYPFVFDFTEEELTYEPQFGSF